MRFKPVEYKIFKTIGVVSGVSDGIVTIVGMSEVAYGETIDIITSEKPVVCLVLNVERETIGAIALDSDVNIKPGLYAMKSGRLMSVPTGEVLLGRIIDPLGNPLMIKVQLLLKNVVW